MKKPFSLSALVSASFLVASCDGSQSEKADQAKSESPEAAAVNAAKIEVNELEGLVTISEAQSQLVAGVRQLTVGLSQQQVKEQLGEPSEETPEALFYKLLEGPEGGHYVSAHLAFDEKGLASAKLRSGHVTMEPSLPELLPTEQ